MERTVRFATTSRGVRVAWARLGSGPTLFVPPGWVSHLDRLWEDPAARAFQESLARTRTLVTFDRPGTGLSDRRRTDFSLEEDVAAAEAVMAAHGERRLALLGISQGGPLAITLAARHPDTVKRLVLYGTFASGRLISRLGVGRSLVSLVRAHWGLGSRTLAHVFVAEEAEDEATMTFLTRLQQDSASGEMAARLLDALYRTDVRSLLPSIRAPALVLHRRDDPAIPVRCGRELAAALPDARFETLPGAVHLAWLGDRDALVSAIRSFLGDPVPAEPVPAVPRPVRARPARTEGPEVRSAPRPYVVEHRDLLRGEPVRPAVRVALAQIAVRPEDQEARGRGLVGLKDAAVGATLERLARFGRRAAQARVDVLLFPELAVDLGRPEMERAVASLARETGMIVVPGSFHDAARAANVARAYAPDGVLWEQEKHLPATIRLGTERITEGILPGPVRRLVIASTWAGRIAIVICRDFLDLDLRVELRHASPPVDLVLNPAFTPVTEDFEAAHFEARRSIYASLLFCNAAAFGRSVVHGPDRGRRRRPLEPGVEELRWKDVDLYALRSARLAWDRRHGADAGFIQSTR